MDCIFPGNYSIIHQSYPLEEEQENRVNAHRMKVLEYATWCRNSSKLELAHKTLF